MLGGAGVHMGFIYFSLAEQRERFKREKKDRMEPDITLKGVG